MTTPFYSGSGVDVYCGDSREVLKQFPRETFALLATDPPYAQEWLSNRRKEKFAPIQNDRPEDAGIVLDVLREAVRAMRNHRHVYIFGPIDLSGFPFTSPVELIWDKERLNSGDVASAWGIAHEKITFATYQWCKAERKGEGLAARLRKGSVLSIPRVKDNRHASEKPIDLFVELIESSTLRGDLILDPFAGSGPAAMAAIMTGRRAVVIDSDESHCATIRDRIKVLREMTVGQLLDGDRP
jgi:DNA modification methylase